MRPFHVLLNLITIAIIVIFPHLGLIPLFGYSIPVLLLAWLVVRYTGDEFKAVSFSFREFEVKAVWVGAIAAISMLAFMQLVFFPVLEMVVTFEEVEIGLYDFVQKGIINLIIMIIMGWLIGGVYEEIVFHGFMFTRLEKMIPGKFGTHITFAITALLFGAYHVQLGMAGLINAFIVGTMYLGLFLHFNRNLWYPVIAHGTYNTIVMILIYLDWL